MAFVPQPAPVENELLDSFMDRVYQPHKVRIWAGFALLLLAVAAYLGVREYRNSRRDAMWTRFREIASRFELSPIGEPDVEAARRQIDEFKLLLSEYPEDSITPHALLAMSKAQVAVGDYEGALATVGDLRTRYKDFALNHLPAGSDDGSAGKTLAATFEENIRRQRDWAAAHTYVHHWPSDDRLALVETTLGSFWLGFYSGDNEAPRHVAGFVERAKRGDYNGTQVYRVIQSVDGSPEQFECGSKASGLLDRGGVRDPAEHDRDEPLDTIEPEETRSTLRHEYRVVSAAKMDSGESATRFTVVARRQGLTKLNGESTPFAAVMDREDSLGTIDRIGRATTYRTHEETKKSDGTYRLGDHPYPAVYIRRISIWSKEKIEDGHTWDTARVATKDPEPWEAGLSSPKPEEFATPKTDK